MTPFPELKAVRAWAIEDLARSGLTPSDIDIEPGLEAFTGLPHYIIWYPSGDGTPSGHILDKDMWVRRYKTGETKYKGPEGRTGLYYTRPHAELLKGDTIWIVEGEKKAIAAAKHLKVPALGIRGCWGWSAKQEPQEALLELAKGKHVVLVLDGDIAHKEDIQRACGTLCRILVAYGASVEVPALPPGEGPDKVGLDDWIMSQRRGNGLAAKFAALPRLDYRSFQPAPSWRVWWLDLSMETIGPQQARVQVPVKNERNTELLIQDMYGERGLVEDRHAGPLVMEEGVYRPYNERADIATITHRIQKDVRASWPRAMVVSSTEGLFGKNQVCLLEDWLKGLKWDGVKRVAGMFSTYWGAQGNSYSHDVGVAFMVGWIDRICNPGGQNDHFLILEGAQGTYKSKSLEVMAGSIAGKRLFRSALAYNNMKELLNMASACSILVMEELSGMNKHDIRQLKDFITNREDAWDKKYERHTRVQARGFVLAGTTNDSHYLQDVTGNRRFLPIKCRGVIDIGGIERDREQIYAEAYVMWKEQIQWWEVRGQAGEAEARRRPDVMEEALVTALERGQHGKLANGCPFVTMRWVCQWLGVPTEDTGRMGGTTNIRVSELMGAAGWEHVQVRDSQVVASSIVGAEQSFFLHGTLSAKPRVWVPSKEWGKTKFSARGTNVPHKEP